MAIRATLVAEVYPTEDIKRVLQAMNTIIPFSEEVDDVDIEEKGRRKLIRVRKEGHEALIKLRSAFRNNRILDTARSLLMTRRGNLRALRFHKQAAYVGKVRLCDEDEMSPLGVISLIINYEGDAQILADWLTPKTERGRPIREATTHELLYGRTNSSEIDG
ncbi:MAG: RNA-binding domain-containing protein [Candidatus Korarchaeota archaeon]|nr:RNA-binding domain-containing protein [Candidatus Korarchaeota archaeon]